jgi:glycerophosphoryl diester phosphodiesterase
MPNMEIEIKKDTPENLEAAVAGVLQAMKDADRAEGIVITSFEPYALEVAMRLAPDQPLGFIAMDWSQEDPWTHAERFDVAKVGINLQHATPDIVARARAAGYCTVAWPCNTPEAAALVDACGFDEICTDNPSLIAPLFGREVREVVSTASRDATGGRYRAVQPGSRP